jgi:hypothetical protein
MEARIIADLLEQLASLKEDNMILQRGLHDRIINEKDAESIDDSIIINTTMKVEGGKEICEDTTEVTFAGRKLVLSLVLTEDEFEPLFSGASWAGTTVWDAAVEMCRFLKTKVSLQGKPVLELGCGRSVI